VAVDQEQYAVAVVTGTGKSSNAEISVVQIRVDPESANVFQYLCESSVSIGAYLGSDYDRN
jgi:hypothetical protein